MQKLGKVYFRADGNAKMGLGHIFRSLALAEMIQRDFECHFITRNQIPSINKEILSTCDGLRIVNSSINNFKEAANLATDLQPNSIIVLDGYHFDTTYQKTFKEKGFKIVCIDDIYNCQFIADAIINHAGGITPQHYKTLNDTNFYLGLSYALLRKPFRDVAKNRKSEKPNHLFICLGGADPKNNTLAVLKNIADAEEENICYLILGSAYKHKTELDNFLKTTNLSIEVLQSLSSEKMVYYMNQCARAITPPSTVAYEYLSTGGTLYLKTIADNQKDIYKYFIENHFALDFDNDFQNKLVEESVNHLGYSTLLDGKQQKRLLSLFYELSSSLRRANQKDVMRYFEWANDPETRQNSYKIAPISLEDHLKWFYEKINRDNIVFYILELNTRPVGQIRFDINGAYAIISFSLDKDYRGKGLGYLLLKKGIEIFKKEFPEMPLIGYVKKSNLASAKAFRALDFEEKDALNIENSYQYTL